MPTQYEVRRQIHGGCRRQKESSCLISVHCSCPPNGLCRASPACHAWQVRRNRFTSTALAWIQATHPRLGRLCPVFDIKHAGGHRFYVDHAVGSHENQVMLNRLRSQPQIIFLNPQFLASQWVNTGSCGSSAGNSASAPVNFHAPATAGARLVAEKVSRVNSGLSGAVCPSCLRAGPQNGRLASRHPAGTLGPTGRTARHDWPAT